jgi:hypothetical protein
MTKLLSAQNLQTFRLWKGRLTLLLPADPLNFSAMI